MRRRILRVVLVLAVVIAGAIAAPTAADAATPTPYTAPALAAAAPGDTCVWWGLLSDANHSLMTTGFDYAGVPGEVTAGLSFQGEDHEFIRCQQASSGLYYLWSTRTHRYVSAELGMTGSQYGMLRARATAIGAWELFRFGTDSATGATTMMSAANGRYVSTEVNDTGGEQDMLRARATSVGAWERYEVSSHPDGGDECDPFSFNSNMPGGLLVSAEIEDTGPYAGMLRTRASSERQWERFVLCHKEGTPYYYLQSLANGKYVSAEIEDTGSNYGMLRARASKVGTWELFTIGHPVRSYGQDTLRSVANGKYVSAEIEYTGSRYGELRARANTPGAWEQFNGYTPPTLPVSNVKIVNDNGHPSLTWTNPTDSNLHAIVISRVDGTDPVWDDYDGNQVAILYEPVPTSAVDSAVTLPSSPHTWTIWTMDDFGQRSAPMTVTY